jgi:hypothetical protein
MLRGGSYPLTVVLPVSNEKFYANLPVDTDKFEIITLLELKQQVEKKFGVKTSDQKIYKDGRLL